MLKQQNIKIKLINSLCTLIFLSYPAVVPFITFSFKSPGKIRYQDRRNVREDCYKMRISFAENSRG